MMGALQEDDKYASYNTPMDGEPAPNYYPFDGCKVPATTDIGFQDWEDSHDFNCCQANLARGLAQVSEWTVLTDRSAMHLNFYGSSAAQTKTPAGKEIVLSQSTQYPIEGFELSSVKVESANGQIGFIKEGDTYTFEMPASDVAVHVQAKEQTKPENPGEQEQEGCSSSFAAASVLGVCALLGGAAALLRKKKRD